MATYEHRLVGYRTEDFPSAEQLVEVICKDHVGTYALPFLCRHSEAGWLNEQGGLLEVNVIGWRLPKSLTRRWR